MNFTEEQKRDMQNEIALHSYNIWQIRNAAKYNIRHSEFHPDSIRREIREKAKLLRQALDHKLWTA